MCWLRWEIGAQAECGFIAEGHGSQERQRRRTLQEAGSHGNDNETDVGRESLGLGVLKSETRGVCPGECGPTGRDSVRRAIYREVLRLGDWLLWGGKESDRKDATRVWASGDQGVKAGWSGGRIAGLFGSLGK